MKKLILFIFAIACFLGLSQPAQAADHNISCTATSCTPSTIVGFFPNTEVWYPTKTLSQTIKLTNTADGAQNIQVYLDNIQQQLEGTDLSQAIQFTITRASDGNIIWDGSLYSFYATTGVNLYQGLPVGTSDTFTFTGHMYSDAGNNYQNLSTSFDLIVAVATEATPTPTTNPTCTISAAPVPGPISLSVISRSEVKVQWGKSTGANGYIISWGTNTFGDNLGTRSVGDTGETTIGGLDVEKNLYYFKARSLKDCARSDWNGAASVGYSPVVPSTPTPTTFPGQILGLATANPSVTPQITGKAENEVVPQGEVKGASTTCPSCIWWQIALGIIALESLFAFGIRKDNLKLAGTVGVLGTAVVGYVVFLLLNPCLERIMLIFVKSDNIFCRLFWLIDLVTIAFFLTLKYYTTRHRE